MKPAKKALFFVNSFTGGGAERVCFDLIGETCLRQNVKVVVLDGTDVYGRLPSNCQVLNLNISPTLSLLRRTSAIVRSTGKVNAFIGNPADYDLITAHLNFSQLVSRLSNVSQKTLYVMHGAQRASSRLGGVISRIWLKFVLGRKRQVVCVSHGIKNELVSNYSIREEQCAVIHNPLNMGKINDLARRVESVTEEGPYMLAVGRLHSVKRFDRLIEVFSKLGIKNLKLVILGEGSQREQLEAQVRLLGIEDMVALPGFTSNPYAWMAKSSIFVCCSDTEAFPVGLIEALSCGARVVSSDCDFGPREIMSGDLSKYLVNPVDNVAGYIEKIEEAMRSYPILPESFFEEYLLASVVEQYKTHWRKTFE